MASMANDVFDSMCRDEFNIGITQEELKKEFKLQNDIDDFEDYCEFRFDEYKEQRREDWH